MIDYRRDPDAPVEECGDCWERVTADGECLRCNPPPPTFECEWCKETIDEDDRAPDVLDQMGFDAGICIWCAEDSGHYTTGLRYD